MTKGELVAKSLAGAWRAAPPTFDLQEAELRQVTHLLLGSGAGALGWWRVRHSSLKETSAAVQLRDAYRMHALLNRAHERHLAQALDAFRAVQIDPLLVKGRAVAAFYPESGLRPFGDWDFCVLPEQYSTARRVVADLAQIAELNIDLHCGLNLLWSEGTVTAQETMAVFARSATVKIGDCVVRVPDVADHLRILCLHFLKHGGWRPLWLCDVAAIVEACDGRLDWGICWGDDARRAWKVACVIKLCEELLGARRSAAMPRAWRQKAVPTWFRKTVLKKWQAPFATRHEGGDLMRDVLPHPRQWWKALRKRWAQSDAIRATQAFNADFDQMPRLPLQLVFAARRAVDFIYRERARER